MNRLTRFLRRFWLTRCHRSAKAEIADLEFEAEQRSARLAWLLREEMRLRAELMWLDVARPRVSRASGPHRLDGVVRPIGTTAISVTQMAPRRRAAR